MTKVCYSELTTIRNNLRDVVPLDTPYALFIDPTNFCNFHCSFCPRNLECFHEYAGKYVHMDMELYKKIISDIKMFPKKLKVVRLYFLGEPLLNPCFCEMFLLLCKSNCCERIEVTTNGSLLTDEIAKEILKASTMFNGEIFFRFSIYGVEQEHFSYVTSNNMNVQTIYDNIAAFYRLRNEGDYANIFLYAKKLRTLNNEDKVFISSFKQIVDEVALEEPMNWSGDGGEDNFLLKKEYTEETLKKMDKNIVYPKICSYLFTTMAIQSDGTVVACCVDWSRKTQYGNARESSLQEIWNGTKLRNLRVMHLKGLRNRIDSCKNCKRMPLDIKDRLDDNNDMIIQRL